MISYINEIDIYLLTIIFKYLSRQDIVRLLNSSKNMYHIYKSKRPSYILHSFIREKDIYDKHPYFFSKEAKQQINYYVKYNIPIELKTIYSILKWYNIYIKLLNYYKIVIYNKKNIIFISSTNLDIFKIFSSITTLPETDTRLIKYFNECEKIKEMHMKRKNKSYLNMNSYQYHQISYDNYMEFVNELYIKLNK